MSAWVLIGGSALAVYAAVVIALVLAGRRSQARALAGFVPDCAVLMKRLAADPRLGRRYKLAVVLLAGYLLMPVDLIPDFIPVAGQVDDAILVLAVLRWVINGGGEELVRAHWPGPPSSLGILIRLSGARAVPAAA